MGGSAERIGIKFGENLIYENQFVHAGGEALSVRRTRRAGQLPHPPGPRPRNLRDLRKPRCHRHRICQLPRYPGKHRLFSGRVSGTSGAPGETLTYSEGTGGTNATFSDFLTRPGARGTGTALIPPSTAWPVMELTSSNQLILTGTQTSSPGSIVIDPTAGQITVNGQSVVTAGGSPGSIDGGAIAWDSSGDLNVNGSASFASGGDLINSALEEGTL